MCLRISSALWLAMGVAACGAEAETRPSPNASATAPASGAVMTCAIGAGAALSPGCMIEQVAGRDEIILYHPDGGFRRLIREPSTGALTARDGADPLITEAGEAGAVQFSIGADRYRVPLELFDTAR